MVNKKIDLIYASREGIMGSLNQQKNIVLRNSEQVQFDLADLDMHLRKIETLSSELDEMENNPNVSNPQLIKVQDEWKLAIDSAGATCGRLEKAIQHFVTKN